MSALVPVLGLYLKMKLFLNRARSNQLDRFLERRFSVSPQKPTMKSLDTAASGIVSRIRSSMSS